MDLISSNRFDMNDRFNPYAYLLEIYDARKDYTSSIGLLNRLAVQYPNEGWIKTQIQHYEQLMRDTTALDTSKGK